MDEFFGDAKRNDKSWIARTLYLETDGPRWTGPAFERCLLLAVLYPIATVFVVWAFSGHVGIAERALLLPPDNPGDHYSILQRAANSLAQILLIYAAIRFHRADGLKVYLWLATASLIFASAFAVLGNGALIVGFGVAAGTFSGPAKGVVAVTGVIGFASMIAADFNLVVVGVGLGAILVTSWAAEWANSRVRLRRFLSTFFVAAFLVCLFATYGFAPSKKWSSAGGLLLFMGLFPLVNAPIDWLAVGFTRALLRRGLLRGSWWPFFYALLDIFVAAILVAVLAFAMVLTIQTFDDIAVLRAGPDARILPLGPLFKGLETAPGDYENWWVWTLLFSSMIPSILNLSIAAAAFLRGLPFVNVWILSRMPHGKAVRERDRLKVAALLTTQLVGGVALTGIATYLVGVYLIPFGLPAFGAIVRDFAADLAAYNAPARLMIWFID